MRVFWKLLTLLASLRLTLVLLVLLVAGVLFAFYQEVRTHWALVVPLVLVAVNLFAAIIVSPVFRRHPGLLVFHLALLSILVLVTAGRLTYLQGRVGVDVGQAFEGQLAEQDAGPWHPNHLDEATFVNEGFTVDYSPGRWRNRTYNKVSWMDERGERHERVIGDGIPLEREGYRFYTTFNKGFAPIFTWVPTGGAEAVRGTVHLPSYPLNDYRQATDWRPPGSERELWVMLELEEEVVPEESAARFRLPESHHLIVRTGERRHQLRPGNSIPLDEGTLVYEGLTTWMGYSVRYDWTTSWLFAAAVIGIAGLGWHYWAKYNRRPWRPRYLDRDDYDGTSDSDTSPGQLS